MNRTISRLRIEAIAPVLIVVFLVLALAGMAHAAKTIRWKIQSGYPRGDVSMELMNDFAKEVKDRSDGRLLIKIYADPELVRTEQLFDAVRQGTLDGVHALGAFWAGVLPVGEVEFGLPVMYRTPGKSLRESADEVRAFFYDRGFADLLRKEYGKLGLYWLDMHSYGPNFNLSTRPVTTCADFNGLKIAAEGAANDFFGLLGARGVQIGGGDRYMGLKLGTIDATQWDISAITALNWHEVAPYWILGIENDQSIGHILLNQKSWDELPQDLQKIVGEAAKNYYDTLLSAYEKELGKVEGLVAQGKLKKSPVDAECEKQVQAAALKVWDEVATRDAASAQALKMVKDWRGL